VPSESGFEKFKAGSQEERTTHPLAHHPKYVNLDGTPYTLGGETLQDRYDRLERQKQAEAYNKEHAHPVPGAYALSEDRHRPVAEAGHTWWPRGGESKAACERVALEINRNGVESVFAGNKRRGLGTYDMRALSLRDDGAEWVCEWGLYLHTARRVIHETGSYGLFHDEYLELGLHRSGDLPNSELLRQVASRRPKSWQWHWPPSGRATDNRYDAAA
jgi:hypothetical protein